MAHEVSQAARGHDFVSLNQRMTFILRNLDGDAHGGFAKMHQQKCGFVQLGSFFIGGDPANCIR